MRRALLPLILLLPLAGCLDPPDGQLAYGAYQLPCGTEPWCQHEIQPDGRTAMVLEDLEVQGPVPLHPTGDEVVILRNVTIRTDGNAIGLSDHGCKGCRILIENSRFIGLGNGTALLVEPATDGPRSKWQLRNVTIAGFAHAMAGRNPLPGHTDPVAPSALDLELTDVHVECRERGFQVAARSLDLSNVTVHGCTGKAAEFTIYESGKVSGSSFGNSRTGLNVHLYGSLKVASSRFHGNAELGLEIMQDVHPSGHAEVTDSTFESNGHRYPDWGGGALTMSQGFIHGSTFQGNAGIALRTATLHYDATDNYWGSPLGPRVCTLLTPPPPGPGDCASFEVRYIPFRTTP